MPRLVFNFISSLGRPYSKVTSRQLLDGIISITALGLNKSPSYAALWLSIRSFNNFWISFYVMCACHADLMALGQASVQPAEVIARSTASVQNDIEWFLIRSNEGHMQEVSHITKTHRYHIQIWSVFARPRKMVWWQNANDTNQLKWSVWKFIFDLPLAADTHECVIHFNVRRSIGLFSKQLNLGFLTNAMHINRLNRQLNGLKWAERTEYVKFGYLKRPFIMYQAHL